MFKSYLDNVENAYEAYRKELRILGEYLRKNNFKYDGIDVKCISFDMEGLIVQVKSLNGDNLWNGNDEIYLHVDELLSHNWIKSGFYVE